MKPISEMTNAEVAAFVQSHLRQSGIEVVLSGGACVSIYTSNRYVSMDLDMINVQFAKRREIREVMQEIGFDANGRHFTHADTDFLVEFPDGPLAVGAEPVKEVHEQELATGTLRMLSPTDCIKDRLAGYYHWNDLQCLEQAIMVARANEFDLGEIARWSEVEGMLDKLEHIREQLTGNEA